MRIEENETSFPVWTNMKFLSRDSKNKKLFCLVHKKVNSLTVLLRFIKARSYYGFYWKISVGSFKSKQVFSSMQVLGAFIDFSHFSKDLCIWVFSILIMPTCTDLSNRKEFKKWSHLSYYQRINLTNNRLKG